VKQAVDFVIQTCVAIAEAHGLGIIHRDLKPSNLFCVRGADGRLTIKVLDFGISKVTGAVASGLTYSTGTGALLGSPHYMSPEQMQSAKTVDGRTDIWSLGIILYELLTGRPPFDSELVPFPHGNNPDGDPMGVGNHHEAIRRTSRLNRRPVESAASAGLRQEAPFHRRGHRARGVRDRRHGDGTPPPPSKCARAVRDSEWNLNRGWGPDCGRDSVATCNPQRADDGVHALAGRRAAQSSTDRRKRWDSATCRSDDFGAAVGEESHDRLGRSEARVCSFSATKWPEASVEGSDRNASGKGWPARLQSALHHG